MSYDELKDWILGVPLAVDQTLESGKAEQLELRCKELDLPHVLYGIASDSSRIAPFLR